MSKGSLDKYYLKKRKQKKRRSSVGQKKARSV